MRRRLRFAAVAPCFVLAVIGMAEAQPQSRPTSRVAAVRLLAEVRALDYLTAEQVALRKQNAVVATRLQDIGDASQTNLRGAIECMKKVLANEKCDSPSALAALGPPAAVSHPESRATSQQRAELGALRAKGQHLRKSRAEIAADQLEAARSVRSRAEPVAQAALAGFASAEGVGERVAALWRAQAQAAADAVSEASRSVAAAADSLSDVAAATASESDEAVGALQAARAQLNQVSAQMAIAERTIARAKAIAAP